MKTKRTLEFGLGLAGAIWSLIGLVFGAIASIFAFGISRMAINDSYTYYNSYSYGHTNGAAADFALTITFIVIIAVLILAIAGGVLSLIGAIQVRNKTTEEKVTKEGVFMLVGGIICGNLLSMAAGIVALARHSKPNPTVEAQTPQSAQE